MSSCASCLQTCRSPSTGSTISPGRERPRTLLRIAVRFVVGVLLVLGQDRLTALGWDELILGEGLAAQVAQHEVDHADLRAAHGPCRAVAEPLDEDRKDD